MKSYTHFTLSERESLQQYLYERKSYREIAKLIGKSPSSICREIKRNVGNNKKRYSPVGATFRYIECRKKCIKKKIIQPETPVYQYVEEKLSSFWSPEIIAYRGKEKGLKVSATTIYRALAENRIMGFSRQTHLRRRGKRRNPNKKNYVAIKPTHTIHERPKIVELKERFGDFEGDTILGKVGKGCAITCVDRKSKLLLGAIAKSKDKEIVRKAFLRAFELANFEIPVETITLDNGSEFAEFRELEKDLNATIYFADTHSPWQRGLSEHTNDMLRFFYPKGTNFLEISEEEFQKVINLINTRPRKSLGYLSPIEFLSKKCCT